MPEKTFEKVNKLPNLFKSKEVIEIKNISKIGERGAHCMLPKKLIGEYKDHTVFLVIGKHIEPEKKEESTCSECHNTLETVQCEKYDIDICRPCCMKKCNEYGRCPNWQEK